MGLMWSGKILKNLWKLTRVTVVLALMLGLSTTNLSASAHPGFRVYAYGQGVNTSSAGVYADHVIQLGTVYDLPCGFLAHPTWLSFQGGTRWVEVGYIDGWFCNASHTHHPTIYWYNRNASGDTWGVYDVSLASNTTHNFQIYYDANNNQYRIYADGVFLQSVVNDLAQYASTNNVAVQAGSESTHGRSYNTAFSDVTNMYHATLAQWYWQAWPNNSGDHDDWGCCQQSKWIRYTSTWGSNIDYNTP